MEENSSFETSSSNQTNDSIENVSLQIKEEQLDLVKKWIRTGAVTIYKESYTQEKTFTVPVKCEELVIEKKTISSANHGHIDVEVPIEVTRILLGEEQVEFKKHWVDLEDFSVYQRHINDIKHFEVTLRHEVPKLKFTESPPGD
ncbi:YsnF/AvaK domain-containing protein [Desulfosporosinus sp.]|uniref:YsnF/AvaK domain-containing protein n=1 Tax=Desulfosporosinus sp. TaxID=157907 RepID=UPI0025C6FA48|nr:YsnF/AvaK domain-containing protein [Desulfosporosinus sp.]MBC2724726.1 YsnF/AvaK domain-containing protein [Desulfosporosinus sp.]MBC2728492.1 YsnF/AvaK domain-containing protein [Desulfosporosinus sp.]